MKKSLKLIALGTTALSLFLVGAVQAQVPPPEEDSESIIDDLINAAPKKDDPSGVSGDEGSVPNDLGAGSKTAAELDPAGILGLADNETSTDPETDSPPAEGVDSVADDLISTDPNRDPPKKDTPFSDVSFDDTIVRDVGSLPGGFDGLGLPFSLIETGASEGRYLGDFEIPASFSTKMRVSYDSNICENYNSGTFFLPNFNKYNQGLVDEAMADINRLSDDQFLDFMDWLDGAEPPLFILRNSPLGRAMDNVDWLNDAEIDEIFALTSERDTDLFWGGGDTRLKIAFNGIFAQALTPKTPLIESPRYFSPRLAGYTFEAPKISINLEYNDADLEAIQNFLNGTGSEVVPSETGAGYDAYIPYSKVYGLDRLQIRADYNYALDNNITDGSLPTITNNNLSSVGGNPGLQEETSDTYTIGSVITPSSIPGLSVAIDYYNIELSDILKPPSEFSYNPSEYRFHLRTNMGGGMVTIDPPTLDLDAGPSDEPIESIIPELSDPFRIEGHIGQDATEATETIETIKPQYNLSFDLSNGFSLNIPYGEYDQSTTTTETPGTTTTTETPGNIYTSNIQFKIEESIFENNQINTSPAQEVVVKLGFPIPPLPLDGNPRIDAGAGDNPLQGEVNAFGNFNLKYDYTDNFRIEAKYDYSDFDDTEVGDGSPPTLTLDEPATSTDGTGTDSAESWTIDPDMIQLRIDFGGGMTRIDPPTLDLDAGPSIEPIESVIDELGPMTGELPEDMRSSGTDTQQGGDSRLAGPQTSINWQDVQRALGEFADIPALDRMRNRDNQHEGWEPSTDSDTSTETGTETGTETSTPSTTETTPSTTTETPSTPTRTDINWNDVANALGEFANQDALNRVQSGEAPTGTETGTSDTNSTPSDTSIGANETPFSWDQISPRIGLNYDIGTPNPVIIRSGIRGTSSDVDLDINMQQIGSKILYRTDPNASLGGLENFSLRSFGIGNYRLDPIFYPLAYEPQIEAAIKDTPGIVRDEPNPYRGKQGNDPFFKSEGTWGQNYADQWAIQHVGFTEEEASAWAAAGNELEEVIVAVIDTGIDWNHADISWDSIWRNNGELPDNGIDDDMNGYIDDLIGWDFFLYNNLPWDEDGHGTFVTGIIAASSDNNTGISGINPAAKIMVLKSLDSFGHTRASYLAEAIAYAVDNGARIINLSVGGEGLSHAEELAVAYAEENGVLVFAAAGNTGTEASNFGFVPYETVVTVGSTTNQDAKSNFSNWGEGIDIMAPGEDVLSLRARRTDLMLNVRHLTYEMGTAYVGDDRRYYRAAGTSFSVPIVAGIASLILSKNPDLTPAEVRRMLYQSARDVDVPGRDQQTGYGLVDATAALNADPAFEIIADISGVEVVQEKGQVLVSVRGTVSANDFDRAQVFIGAGENPDSWKAVGDKLKKPVSAGVLTKIPAGEFQGAPVWIIRIVVTHKNGKTREERFTLTLG